MTTRRPIILDVDTGTDDALALAYAVKSPEIDLVAVTTVAGNVDVEKVTANTLAVLDWLGQMKSRCIGAPVDRWCDRMSTRRTFTTRAGLVAPDFRPLSAMSAPIADRPR